MGLINGVGGMASNFAKGVADTISKTKVGEKGIGFYNDVLKMSDDEIAKSVARTAATKPKSTVGKMFQEVEAANMDPSKLSTQDIKSMFIANENARLDKKNIKETMTKEAVEKAKAANEAKANRAWKQAGAGDYFGNAEDGFNTDRIATVIGGAAALSVGASITDRMVNPGTLTRDQYGNRDIVGIPFI